MEVAWTISVCGLPQVRFSRGGSAMSQARTQVEEIR